MKKYESIKKVVFNLSFNRHNNEDAIMENKKNKNLLLFTVYRGKNSEGINFPMMKPEWLYVLEYLIQIYQI